MRANSLHRVLVIASPEVRNHDPTKKPPPQTARRPARLKLSAEESLKRMREIDQRKQAMIASVRRKQRQREVFPC
jgi:hypothetical protein